MTLVTKIEIQNNCYSNNSGIINVNTNNVPFANNDASYAFYNCNAIKNVYGLNSNITNMSHAFEYTWQNTASYAGVINVTLPTSLQDASYIFKNRPGELEITLPSSITNAYMAFESCYHIKKVTGELYNCSNMQSMYEWALYGTNNSYNLANYTASQAENIDMSRCFYQCQKLQITRPLPPNVTNISRCFYNTNITSLTGSMNSGGDMSYAFYNCKKLQNVNLSVNNGQSGNMAYAFWNCPQLQTINLYINNAQNVNYYNAFYNCQKLTTPPVITNSTATSLADAFLNCRNLSATSNFQDFYNIFSGATNMNRTFFNCVNANFANVTVPKTVTDLTWCFGHTKIKKIHIPKTDNEVYMSQFVSNCPSLTDVTGYLYAKNWVGGVNSSITFGNRMDNVVNFTVNLGSSMTDISHTFEGINYDSYSFYGFLKLKHGPVNFGGAVNMAYTFNNCQNLISVGNIPNTVTNMRCCFFHCANLTQVGDTPGVITNLPDSVIVARAAFSECLNLPHLPFPGNSVTDLDNYAFNCQKITSYNYYFPMSVQRMNQTFWNCQNLTGDIYIKSNQVGYATNCFMNTSLPKNVYIPFKYANDVYTQTYNTFNAIYGTGANGVTLKNYTELYT